MKKAISDVPEIIHVVHVVCRHILTSPLLFNFTATAKPAVSTGKLPNQLGEMLLFSRCELPKYI